MKSKFSTIEIQEKTEARTAIFISHANPEDNAFTLWLGAKLSAIGYEVWADIFCLSGGDDWQRRLEHALRCRARKVLLVANAKSVQKQGVRNEIQIASEVANMIDDHEFIIPLRLAPYKPPFLVAHAQYIDFRGGWSKGLAELLSTLEGTYNIPQTPKTSCSLWRDIQLLHAKEIANSPEPLMSNWLCIKRIPETIRYYNFDGGINHDHAQQKVKSAPWPTSKYRRGFLAFAPLDDLRDHFGSDLPLYVESELDTRQFVESGWPRLQMNLLDSRKIFSDLSRQATENLLRLKGLKAYKLSGKRLAWWIPIGIGPEGRIAFRWSQLSGSRQIQGKSERRSMRWHFGVSFTIYSSPIQHIRLISRLIFTIDGYEPIGNPKRMHRWRRSFAKSWRNDRWRDMLLAFLHWLGEGNDTILVPVSTDSELAFELPPISWIAPVSIPTEYENLETEIEDPYDDNNWLDDDIDSSGEDEADDEDQF